MVYFFSALRAMCTGFPSTAYVVMFTSSVTVAVGSWIYEHVGEPKPHISNNRIQFRLSDRLTPWDPSHNYYTPPEHARNKEQYVEKRICHGSFETDFSRPKSWKPVYGGY